LEESVTTTTQEHGRRAHIKTVNIFINDVKHVVPDAPITGREIASLGGVPEGNQIFLEVPGPGDDKPIGPDQTIDPKSGMRFYDVPAGNLG
jgi:hypothetical protein